MNDNYKPVFIIGGSRTGSELLKNIIRKYSNINFVPEMFLLCPRWLHKDFKATANKALIKNTDKYDIDMLLDVIFSKTAYGYLWTTVDEFDRAELKKYFERNNNDLRGIFLSIMEYHSIMKNKTRLGAKFPVHYSYAETLKHWFPDCVIIHTVRDPRAIYVSQSNKYIRKSNNIIGQTIIRIVHFSHIVIQTLWTSKIHNRLSIYNNYYLFRYEDFLSAPEKSMSSLCDFVEIKYDEKMSNPEIYSNSSFLDKRGEGKGLNKSSADSWRSKIGFVSRVFIGIFCRKTMKSFGYK